MVKSFQSMFVAVALALSCPAPASAQTPAPPGAAAQTHSRSNDLRAQLLWNKLSDADKEAITNVIQSHDVLGEHPELLHLISLGQVAPTQKADAVALISSSYKLNSTQAAELADIIGVENGVE